MRILSQLSQRTNTQISASHVSISNFNTLKILDLYIEDQNKDTLLYSPEVSAKLDSININNHYLSLSSFQLKNPIVNISQNKDSVFNFTFLVDSLTSKDTSKEIKSATDSTRWKLAFNKINLSQGNFNISILGKEKAEIKQFNLDANIKANAINLNSLTFKMDTGINLQSATAHLILEKDSICLHDFSAQTDHSQITICDIYIASDSGNIKNSTIESLKINAQSNNTSISSKDLAFFIPLLDTINNDIIINGKISGNTSHLYSENLHIAIDSTANLAFDFEAKNISNIDSSTFNLRFYDMSADIFSCINAYKSIFPDSETDLSEYSHIRNINIEGEIIGTGKKIKTIGKIKSDYGQIYTNGAIELNDNLKINSYAGNISTSGFGVGRFLQKEETLGCIVGKLQINGYTKDGEFESHYEGGIENIGINGYDYKNITFNGDIRRLYFNGNFAIDDPNAKFDFIGEVDVNSEQPKFNYILDLQKMEFVPTNLINSYERLSLQCKVNTELLGSNIDNLNGKISIDSLTLCSENGELFTDSILVKFKPLDARPSITLNSEYVNGNILGSYNFSEILGFFNYALGKHIAYLPQKFNKPIASTINNFKYSLEINKLDNIAKVIDLPFKSNGFSKINGCIDATKNLYNSHITIPYVATEKQYLDSITLHIENTKKSFTTKADIQNLLFSDKRQINDVNLDFTAQDDTMRFITTWKDEEKEGYSGDFEAKLWLKPYNQSIETFIEVQPSQFVFADSIWSLNKHIISARPQHIHINNLILEKKSSYFSLNGTASNSIEDKLSLKMNKFNIGNVSKFLSVKNFDFQGILDGKANLHSVLDKPLFSSNLYIEKTVVNNSNWGNITANTTWNAELEKLNIYVDSKVDSIENKLFLIGGSYFPKNDSLHVKADVDNFDIGFLQAFLKKTLNDLKGTASGKIIAKGSIKHPELYGAAKVNNGQFRIDYLSSNFFTNDSIHFDNNRFVFDHTVVTDQENNIATVRGDIEHQKYRNMMVDIIIESDRFLAMNTDITENEYFYGDMYYSGAITIKSNDKATIIGSNASTMQGSIITIPLSPVSVANKNNFITYAGNTTINNTVQNKDKEFLYEFKTKPKRKLIIDMNFNVTPDGTIRLEFDPGTGEVIEAVGRGDLNVKFQQGQPFQMFGDYVIDKGKYRFSLEQIFNKNLDINAGSSLRWSGKPGDATMDIIAQYSTHSSLYNLMPDAIGEKNKNRRVPVNVKLNMSESLAKPNITFDIELPNTDRETQQSVSNIINNDEEMSRQVLSLMITNSFYTPEYYSNGTAQGTAQLTNMAAVTVSEFLSNQLSKWMSQISDKFDLGVRYMPEQEIVGQGYTPDEVGVIISTQFFDDRLTVNGNVGYQNYNEVTKPSNVNSNFVGEFDVELKIIESIKLKAYSRQNDDILYENSNMKYGIGVAYEKSFTNFFDWFSRNEKKKNDKAIRRKEEDNKIEANTEADN